MEIDKATVPESAVCFYNEETMVVRGANLRDDLIGKVGFVDCFDRLVTGRRPDAVAGRMTLAAAPMAC